MSKQKNLHHFFLVLLSIILSCSTFQNLNAQNSKKNKVRLKAAYTKIVDVASFVDIAATAKINKKNVKVAGISLQVFNEIGDDKIKLGDIVTDSKGKCKFDLKNLSEIKPDSTNTYTIVVQFKGDETYKKAKKSISFKNAAIQAHLVTKDSTNYISASLRDLGTTAPIVGESLSVQLQRIFKPLLIGEEFNETDEDGTIFVPIEEGIPGVDGNLIFEVVLNDNDDYGTVKALVDAPIGIPIVDESTYDERTMWSPRSKTPIFLLILTNLMIFVIWGIIIYLISNLIIMYKS